MILGDVDVLVDVVIVFFTAAMFMFALVRSAVLGSSLEVRFYGAGINNLAKCW